MTPTEAFIAGINSLPWWIELPATVIALLLFILLIQWRR